MAKEDLDHRGSGVNLAVVYRQIDQLTPDPANPRRHSCKQIRQIANSIRAFGLNVPVLIDRKGKIIAGHGRLLPSARHNRSADAVPRSLDPSAGPRLQDTDNRLTEIATWDEGLLAQQLKDLSLLGLDFSRELTGFEMGEIDLRIASLEDVPDQADDPSDALPEFSTQPPVSKSGICRCSVAIVCCAAALSMSRRSPH
jgi:ParB-like chromosome segregation protein Spo0J